MRRRLIMALRSNDIIAQPSSRKELWQSEIKGLPEKVRIITDNYFNVLLRLELVSLFHPKFWLIDSNLDSTNEYKLIFLIFLRRHWKHPYHVTSFQENVMLVIQLFYSPYWAALYSWIFTFRSEPLISTDFDRYVPEDFILHVCKREWREAEKGGGGGVEGVNRFSDRRIWP